MSDFDYSILAKINWEYLKRFKICADTKSFRKAAELLAIRPNAIVSQLNTLEADLGFNLFERINHNRTTRLTFQGEKIYQLISLASLYLSGSRPYDENIKEILKPQNQIKIVTTPGLARSLLPYLISDFLKTNPDYVIKVISSGPSIEISDDEIFIRSDVKDQPDIIKEVLGEVSMNLYASENYLQNYGIPESVSDLQYHKIFTFDSVTYGNTNWGLLSSKGFPVATQIFSDSIEFLHEMCCQDYGIVELAHIYKRSKKLVQILRNIEVPKHTIYLSYSKKSYSNLNIAPFIKFTREYCQNDFERLGSAYE